MSTTNQKVQATRSISARSYTLGALGGGIRGYELGVIGAVLLYAPQALHFEDSVGIVVAAALIGSLLGAPASGPIADHFGRRVPLAGAGLLYTVGIVIAATAQTFALLVTGRIVLGVAVGVATALIPVYLGEISPARSRGGRASLFQLMIAVGNVIAAIVAYELAADAAWRWMIAIGAFPAVLMFAGSFFLPESPRWLVSKGREHDARDVLARTRQPHEVEDEINAIKAILANRRRQLGVTTLLGTPGLRKLLLIGSVLGIFQQFIGINTITYYSPVVLSQIGFSNQASILSSVGFTSLALVFTAVMVFFVVDRFGRRKPLLYGAVGMGAAMLALGLDFQAGGGSGGGAGGWVAIVCLAAFQIAFALSWGGIVWTVLGEMYPLRVRATAMGIATFMTEGASVIVSFFIGNILGSTKGDPSIFYAFAVMAVLAFLWVAFMLPETRNRTLEDLEQFLAPEDRLTPSTASTSVTATGTA